MTLQAVGFFFQALKFNNDCLVRFYKLNKSRLPRLLWNLIKLLKHPAIGIEVSEPREQQWSIELKTETFLPLSFG